MYQQKKVIILSTISLIGLVLLFNLVYHSIFSLTSILLCILYGLGIAVSSLLLLQSFDGNNPFINKLCSSGSGNGCNNILGASASKILNGTVSWSEIGFFYFLISFCTLCFSDSKNITISFLTIINILSLPDNVTSQWTTDSDCKSGCSTYCAGANQGGGDCASYNYTFTQTT